MLINSLVDWKIIIPQSTKGSVLSNNFTILPLKFVQVISLLVSAADTLSAARPGARSESLDNYIKRLQQLEDLSNEFKGVDKTYALQAGREVRIIVKPEEITDAEAVKLARDIKNKIETTMNYPGTIKVTVIRETRVQEVAR